MLDPASVLLGSCLLDSLIADKAMQAGVTPASMPTPELAKLWGAVISLRGQGKPLSITGIALHLGATCPYEALMAAETNAPTSLHADKAITETLFAARLRQMQPLLADLQGAAKAGDKEAVEAITPLLQEVLAPKVAEPSQSMAEAAEEALKAAEGKIQGKVDPSAINWPTAHMNRVFYPIGRHELVIAGARPATGKTSLLLQLVGQAVGDKRRTVHFALETSTVQTMHQLCGQRAEVDLRNLGLAEKARIDRFTGALRHLASGEHLRIFDRDMSMTAIEARCRALKASWQPELVTIDYLTLIQGGHGKSLYEKITDVANRLVELRKMMDCPVVVAAQLSRGVESEDREPRMADARDSGAIEQAAHRMVFIWRPKNDYNGIPQVGADVGQKSHYDCFFLQAKFRDGPVASIRTRFASNYAKFQEP